MDTSQTFNLTLINLCFSNLVDGSSKSKTAVMERFFLKSSSKVNTQPECVPDRLPSTQKSPVSESVIKNEQGVKCTEEFKTEHELSRKSVQEENCSPVKNTIESFFSRKLLSEKDKLTCEKPVLQNTTQNVSAVQHGELPKILIEETSTTFSDKETKKTSEIPHTISSEEYQLLSDILKTNVDVTTFLELPSFIQEEIISQQEGLNEITVQRLTDIVRRKHSDNVIKEAYEERKSCEVPGKNRSASLSEAGNSSLTDSSCDAIPPDIDVAVFRELPTSVQKSLSNEWKTTAEFEKMKKRKLSYSPKEDKKLNKKTINITSYFSKK